MKVIIVVDNDAYLNYDNDTEFTFGQVQQEIYESYNHGKDWTGYDHAWRTDERLIALAENMHMFKVAELPDNTTDFMAYARMEDNEEELFYVVDGKIYWCK